MALAAKMASQQVSLKKLDVNQLVCNSKESAHAIATLVEHSQAVTAVEICIEGHIGREGWSSIRRAVQALSESFGQEISLESVQRSMRAGKREDLKTIWENVFKWEVNGWWEDQDGIEVFTFSKADGDVGWWNAADGQRRGLEAFIDMTEEEFWDDFNISEEAS